MQRSHVVHLTRRQLLLASLVLTVCSLPSYAQNPEADSPIQPVIESSNTRGSESSHHGAGSIEVTGPALRDKLFLRQSITSGRLEIELSKLALQKASGADVRQFANFILADRTRISDGLTSAAEAQGVMLPTKLPSREQAVYARLSTLSGEDFDREYIKTTSDTQRKDLHAFRSEAASTQDSGLRNTVQDAVMRIHHHLVLAEAVARSKDVELTRQEKVAAAATPR